jgi:hypothetical protein
MFETTHPFLVLKPYKIPLETIYCKHIFVMKKTKELPHNIIWMNENYGPIRLPRKNLLRARAMYMGEPVHKCESHGRW